MSWQVAIIVFICLPLIALALIALFCLPGRRNPVIRAKPVPDGRIYSVGRVLKP